ncbi:NAD(P)-dependent oxidoreductase [Sphingomonas sp. LaA6.9]|uniref:NAD-dependent epimerase/dehydratase family protein n=1 Tax=Sphingomonas sp. LaA6.9 TaxID=2919914 RepID=UPI001F50403E|nr:NAD(P)H-binding protein [Sphingomonas sp. LaA6.9]MCJ8158259.1 NAD(P)H-binding protein [Sphingomonas sp. LaA6.9]
MTTTLALTGATGFVGKTVIRLALDKGFQIRALTRRPQPARTGVTWIDGALDRPESLAELAEGSDAVMHIAGVVNAPDRAGFVAGNVDGTRAMVEAAAAARVRRFIHVSSLAAREPDLSDYGWSKAEAEAVVAASGLDWTMVRPPAIYGPEDTEMFEMFRMARRGLVLLPPGGRMSVIEVGDLARLLLALVPDRTSFGAVYEADDGVAGGWTHKGFAEALGYAVDRRVKTFAAPKSMLRVAARVDRTLRRSRAKLTPDRVNYFSHPDWVIDPARRPPASLWEPQVNTRAGLKATAAWYRRKGWLT